jgi:hypothetical protein
MSYNILRKIFEPVKCKEGWRIRSNELRKLVTGKDTVNYIKTQRIKMWGHPDRMEVIKLVENITDWNPIGVRTSGRTKNRWRDEVINDLDKLKLRNCSQIVKDKSLK